MRPENFEAWGELKRGLQCTLATGESLYSSFEFLRLLQARGCDIIQPDICVVGGVMEMLKINALAEAHFVSIAPHNPMGPLATAVNVHFCAAQQFPLPGVPAAARPRLRLRHRPAGGPQHRPAPAGRVVRAGPLSAQGRLSGAAPGPAGWGVEMDMEVLGKEDYVHWERKVPVKPDGSTGYAVRGGAARGSVSWRD